MALAVHRFPNFYEYWMMSPLRKHAKYKKFLFAIFSFFSISWYPGITESREIKISSKITPFVKIVCFRSGLSIGKEIIFKLKRHQLKAEEKSGHLFYTNFGALASAYGLFKTFNYPIYLPTFFRAPLITPFCFPTWAFSQLLRYQNTHLAMLNSVFGALYLKKIPALAFQKELIEAPLRINWFGELTKYLDV